MCTPEMVAIVAMYREMLANPLPANTEVELEARLGTMMPDGAFTPGVPPTLMHKFLRSIGTAPTTTKTGWQESHDYFFTAEIKERKGHPCRKLELRTSVNFDPNALHVHTVTISKNRVATATVPLHENMCLRLSLSSERLITEQLPQIVNPYHVRIKQRTTHAFDQCWRYDCTQVWRGADRTQAERVQRCNPPICEIEIELTGDHAKAYLQGHSDHHIALSFLMKMQQVAACTQAPDA